VQASPVLNIASDDTLSKAASGLMLSHVETRVFQLQGATGLASVGWTLALPRSASIPGPG